MQTIYLDGRELDSAAAVHAQLKLLLDLPDYYGGNADALHDCLSERREPPRVCLRHEAQPEAADALRKARRVVEDLDGEWIEL